MTVSSPVAKVAGLGNGVATVFSFSPIVIFESEDLVVTHVDADGVETTLVEGTGAANYSVTPVTFPDEGGTGSVVYPADQVTPMPSGEKIVMKRVLDFEQATDLQNQSTYFPDVLEKQFDKEIMLLIQIKEAVDRALKLTTGDDDASVSASLPTVVDQATKFLRVKADESGLEWAAQSSTTSSASNATPQDVGTPASDPGTGVDFARDDHVHRLSQSARTAQRLSLYHHGA